MLKKLHEEYHAKGKKVCMCFVDQEKAFSIVRRKVLEWAMMKKGISDVLVRFVMSVYEEAKKEWILSCQRSLRLKWGCTKDLCCRIFFCSCGCC